MAEANCLLLTVRAPFVTNIAQIGDKTWLNFDNDPLHLDTPLGFFVFTKLDNRTGDVRDLTDFADA